MMMSKLDRDGAAPTRDEVIAEYWAASKHHAEVFKQFGWPSPELSAANSRCWRANAWMKYLLGLEWNQPIPAEYDR